MYFDDLQTSCTEAPKPATCVHEYVYDILVYVHKVQAEVYKQICTSE